MDVDKEVTMKANLGRSLPDMLKKSLRGIAFIGIALTSLALIPGQALAAYPDRPIKIYVMAAPGGATDIVARLVAEHMSKTLKQQIIVENQPGGGGTVALSAVAHAKPDGYSLLISTSVVVAAPALYSKLPYDTEKSFAPISQLVTFLNMFVTHPGFPAKQLAEFIPYAKANEVKLASGGIGGNTWVLTMKLNKTAGTKIKYLPYKGIGPALIDLVGGHVDAALGDVAALKQLLAAGKILPIAVTSPKRAPGFPNVPAISEAVPGFEHQGWIGCLAPAGTPKDVVQTLYKAVAAALADPAVRGRMQNDDFGIVGSTPEEFSDFFKKELAEHATVIKATGVKLEQ
jgi:tripartite-type tricarboxylate transporter receptor subunit TctC